VCEEKVFQTRSLAVNKRIDSPVAKLHHARGLARFGLSGVTDPLKLLKKLLNVGPLVLSVGLECHFDRRLSVTGAVLDLRQVSHRLDEYLDVFSIGASA
jgi:hypothetical protein